MALFIKSPNVFISFFKIKNIKILCIFAVWTNLNY